MNLTRIQIALRDVDWVSHISPIRIWISAPVTMYEKARITANPITNEILNGVDESNFIPIEGSAPPVSHEVLNSLVNGGHTWEFGVYR